LLPPAANRWESYGKLAMTSRRFPPPWSVEELDACFVVKDSAGQKLAYVYFEDEPGRRSAAKLAHQRRGAADSGEHCEVADIACAIS
jgi:hypothetical protein